MLIGGGPVNANVRRSNNAAIDAREISVLNQTDLRSTGLSTTRTTSASAATTTDIEPNPERDHLAPIIMIAKR